MNFIKSLQKLTQNKKVILYAFVFLIAFYLLNDSTFAADASGLDFQQTKETVTTWSNGLLSGISMILALFMYLSTIFLSPAWINGSLFGLNGYFKDIWILVSNLVYFIFAFILIWIAFMNIIGRNADQYQLKQALPKFIVGVLIVPFSWFLVQFILSLSAILTIASLSLPFETFETYHQTMEGVTVPTDCTLDLRSKTEKTAASNGGQVQEGYFHCKEGKEVSLNELGGNADAIDSIFGIIAMYNYGVLGLERTDGIDQIDMNLVQNFGDLVVKIVFDLLFVFVYSILMIAIGVVLMVRGIYIWIYIMISPVFGLMYFFDKKDGGGDGFFAKFNVKEFIALAMVPVYTMLALSFGLLFLFIVGTGMTTSSTQSQSGGGVSVANNKVEVGKFTLNIEGQVSKVANSTNLLKQIGNDTLGIVGSLILKVFGIVILWGAVMAALRTSEITKTITQPLHDFGAKVGQIMTSAPGNLPLFGGQSMNSMNTVASKFGGYIDQKNVDRASNFVTKNMPFMDTGGAQRVTDNERNKAKVNSINANGPTNELLDAWQSYLKNQGKVSNINNLEGSKDLLKLYAEKVGINGAKDMKLNSEPDIAKLITDIEGKFESSTVGRGALENNQAGQVLGSTEIDRLIEKISDNGNNNSSSTNNTNIRVDVNGILSGIGVQDVQLNKDNSGKYNTTGDDSYIAKNITDIKQVGLIDKFTDNLKDNLRKYYNDKGEYVSGGGQTGGKFPWEITPNP
ncbi:MAG: hypothetical protein PHS49_05355 [Candidatus Gracilibacteria bacterium]|nr:hypothetical protein [Candidatus Gracilibacteria bacterium]